MVEDIDIQTVNSGNYSNNIMVQNQTVQNVHTENIMVQNTLQVTYKTHAFLTFLNTKNIMETH